MKRVFAAIAALGMATALAFTASPSANAATASVPLKIVASQCVRDLLWVGSNYGVSVANWWPRGTVDHCAYKYRLSDEDVSYDYYMVEMVSDYTLASGHREYGARGRHTVTSNKSAFNGIFDATKSYTSSSSCSTPVTIAAAAGPFSVSVSPSACDGYSILRDSYGSSWAQWTASRVGGVDSFESVFTQKVPKGSVPTFSTIFTRPAWGHSKTGGHFSNDEAYVNLYLKV